MGKYISSHGVQVARRRQESMALRFQSAGAPATVRFVGGVDMAYSRNPRHATIRCGAVGSHAVVAAVVWDMEARHCVQAVGVRRTVAFPYIPGLLSFREAPLMMAAIRRITHPVDIWLIDGHGISHPRGCGLATHIGVTLNLPTIGVAKSLLTGWLAGANKLPPADMALDRLMCTWQGRERLAGYAIRPRTGHDPLYVSPGNRISAEQALKTVVDCLKAENRLAEPIRLADLLCAKLRLIPPHQRGRIAEVLRAAVTA